MQPDYPQQQNPYEFIMNHNHQPKRGLFGGSNKILQVSMVVILVLIGVAVVGYILSSLLGSGKLRKDILIDVAAQQTEIIRVADQGRTKTQDKATLSFLAEVKLSVTSELNQTTTLLKEAQHTTTAKELAKARDTAVDTKLKAAESSNNYETTIKEVIQTNLDNYQATLKKDYDSAKNAKEKQLLNTLYRQIGPLADK